MSKYIMRLDDAAIKMDVEKWEQMECLLDKYKIKPLVGVIPNCKDDLMEIYDTDAIFWEKVHRWEQKGWEIALHGYDHVYCSKSGGVNPVNHRSEFAGMSLDIQRKKIRDGVKIFRNHGINPKVFFAPSHTFDLNTLIALKEESDIRIISDTIANDTYEKYGITFVPQQSGSVRRLPFSTVTFCYHPNMMNETDFENLELFLVENNNSFISFPLKETKRKINILDYILKNLYFMRKKK